MKIQLKKKKTKQQSSVPVNLWTDLEANDILKLLFNEFLEQWEFSNAHLTVHQILRSTHFQFDCLSSLQKTILSILSRWAHFIDFYTLFTSDRMPFSFLFHTEHHLHGKRQHWVVTNNDIINLIRAAHIELTIISLHQRTGRKNVTCKRNLLPHFMWFYPMSLLMICSVAPGTIENNIENE